MSSPAQSAAVIRTPALTSSFSSNARSTSHAAACRRTAPVLLPGVLCMMAASVSAAACACSSPSDSTALAISVSRFLQLSTVEQPLFARRTDVLIMICKHGLYLGRQWWKELLTFLQSSEARAEPGRGSEQGRQGGTKRIRDGGCGGRTCGPLARRGRRCRWRAPLTAPSCALRPSCQAAWRMPHALTSCWLLCQTKGHYGHTQYAAPDAIICSELQVAFTTCQR